MRQSLVVIPQAKWASYPGQLVHQRVDEFLGNPVELLVAIPAGFGEMASWLFHTKAFSWACLPLVPIATVVARTFDFVLRDQNVGSDEECS